MKKFIPESIKQVLRPMYYKLKGFEPPTGSDPRWLAVKKKLAKAQSIIDLGCGNNPVKRATAAVDLHMEPEERELGSGPVIDTDQMKEKGIQFVNSRVDAKLPFKDKEFDFAYSHHVFEHLDDPTCACEEMTRIAKAGVIITPSFFAELSFGRPYHRWMLMDRGNKLLFFRKRPFEDRPFGESPQWNGEKSKWEITEKTNPFDMLLNDSDWYHGEEGEMPRLSRILKKHWESRSPLLEVIFLWEDHFQWEIYE